eukprot:2443196-Rhodomonas_salina.2
MKRLLPKRTAQPEAARGGRERGGVSTRRLFASRAASDACLACCKANLTHVESIHRLPRRCVLLVT